MRTKIKNDKRVAEYQRELIETHYAEVETMYKQMRRWRHDYRNHIAAMKAYAENGNLDAIKKYLDELDTDLNTVDTVIKTGNAMADAILNSKISLAKSKGIEVKATAHIPVALKISDLDLCVIIGNLFDNAIDASVALPEGNRIIRVYMDMKGTQLYISFTNFTAGKKLKKNQRTVFIDKARGLARLRACQHRRGRKQIQRLPLAKQRGRCFYYGNTASAGVIFAVRHKIRAIRHKNMSNRFFCDMI